jgi:hypothetical protein
MEFPQSSSKDKGKVEEEGFSYNGGGFNNDR